ncbi:TIGR02453 family protein [Roseibium sp. RKSG952]|uniref:TIGR02453 family protein n=1 Tax=Roseibium sp. RKSG952 TaxID=2529384 RepID=UPI0012BD0C62|nr:TIGR02453 family protein [Roseibium sp. RKSG952]MTI03821.1 TIGR02453 family protein [Roseibium sp. RKSG952]
MSEPFANLISDTRVFLSELSANNNRDWFVDHKSRYEADLKGPALGLLDAFSQQISGCTGTKLFRPQRDVRFSKDKTPYHTHLHMAWWLPVKSSLQVGFFFGISPSYTRIGGGAMGFDKSGLTVWRDAVGGTTGDTLAIVLTDLANQGFERSEPELKRVPAPFEKDHPHGDLLRCKSVTLWRDLPEGDITKPITALTNTYQSLEGFQEMLQTDI